jgi:hypothetical protein
MSVYPYTVVPGNLKKYLTTIQSNGIPPKLTQTVLASQGFKSTNDRAIIGILRGLEFIRDDGTPTDRWRAYRDKQKAGSVLAQAIQGMYADLFGIYPDAYRKDDEALRNFFRAHTTVGDRALSAIVSTFRTLCDLASFESSSEDGNGRPNIEDDPGSNGFREPTETSSSPNIRTSALRSKESPLTININIQLQLPATQDADVYSKLFQALRNHLLES